MPRKGAGPRLWFDKARGTWTILDGKRRERTGCAERQTVEAQQALKAYIGEKHEVVATDDPCLADILTVYLDEHVPTLPQPVHGENPAVYRIASLAAWGGLKGLKDVTTANCRLYVAHREEENVRKAIETEIRIARREKRDPDIAAAEIDAPAGTVGARSDLEVLRAAMGYWHREKKPLKVLPAVWLPDKPEGRKQWCTRTQVAMLLWRSRRVLHNLEPDPTKRPRLVRHLSRFIITAFYTGSRSGVVLGTRYRMLDFENEYMQRKPHGARKSKKRAPAHKMPKRLKSWLLRWQRIDGSKA